MADTAGSQYEVHATASSSSSQLPLQQQQQQHTQQQQLTQQQHTQQPPPQKPQTPRTPASPSAVAATRSRAATSASRISSDANSFGGTFAGSNSVEQLFIEKERGFMQYHQHLEHQFMEADAEVMRLMNAVHLNKVSRDHSLEKLRAKLNEMKQRHEETMYRSRVEWNLTSTKMEQLAEKHAAEVRGALAEDGRMVEETEKYFKDIRAEVCRLYGDVAKVTDFRVQRSKKLAEGVSAKLDEIRLAVNAERSIREDSESTLLELFGQMGERITQDLERNTQERKATGERLSALVASVTKVLGHIEQVQGNGNALGSSDTSSKCRAMEMPSG